MPNKVRAVINKRHPGKNRHGDRVESRRALTRFKVFGPSSIPFGPEKFTIPSNKMDSEDYTDLMTYEVRESEQKRGEFVAFAIDNASHGEEYIALFSGPNARERAEEYVAWKNSTVDAPKVAPQSR